MNSNFKDFNKALEQKKEIYLRIKVIPGASKSEIIEIMEDETVKIHIAAPPEKGKANIELIRFLSREFGTSKDKIRIISGAGERMKLVKIKL
jgi:uncharacterized protein